MSWQICPFPEHSGKYHGSNTCQTHKIYEISQKGCDIDGEDRKGVIL